MLSKRVRNITPSATVELTGKVNEMKRKGIDVIRFSVGEPDFGTPAHISEAGRRAIAEGYTRYTEAAGMLELRESVCRKLERDNDLHYEPDEIIISNGAKQDLARSPKLDPHFTKVPKERRASVTTIENTETESTYAEPDRTHAA